MDAARLTAYRAGRAAGLLPRYAYFDATRAAPPPLGATWTRDRRGNDRATLTADGFDLTIASAPDDCADLSFYGSWEGKRTDRHSVDRKRAGTWEGSGHLRFWDPPERFADTLAYFRKAGNARHVADVLTRAQVRDTWRAAEDYTRKGGSYVVTVTAYRRGVELGRSSCGGVDFSGNETAAEARVTIESMARDLIPEAVAEARATLLELCTCADGAAAPAGS